MRLGLRYPAGTFPAASHDGIAPYSHVPVGTDGRTSGSLSMENSLINTTTYATSRRTNLSIFLCLGRGRDSSYPPPPAQSRTSGITAYGSYLRS
ncbi:protein of unknown function [Acidithiobacillus ferrivorans]|uniref:Uncharacterized protein n=1 Tax=Acidithiobacillus ferrivorans TaxID=160808 RepID=A0ABY1MWF1_9PROT|nr:protein of unknown function [Acidithiobacillus ferrivorans]